MFRFFFLFNKNISTHSLTRRLTNNATINNISFVISTHSLTRRLTSVCFSICFNTLYFNSQPHKEADLLILFFIFSLQYFNSQPHKEADDLSRVLKINRKHFNSQPHKEADMDSATSSSLKNISTHSLTRRLTFGT